MKRSFLSAFLACAGLFSAAAVPVTFQVDLAPRINSGDFDPTTDSVEVRGSFNNWSGGFSLSRTNETSTVYTGTTDISGSAGADEQFKFVQVRDGNATWESTPNRDFALPGATTVLPVNYFNNVWEGAPVTVKFLVNMATQQAAGAFNPAGGDFVEVRGSFNNWGAGLTLMPSSADPNIYEGSADVPDAPGSQVPYKFVINHPDSTVVWENDPNRTFTQTVDAQALPIVYFNNVTGVPIKAAVTFQVDMTAQIGAGHFDTNTQQVYIRGNKMGWDVPPQGLQLFEDASHSGIFTNTYQTDGQITGDNIEYKATMWTPDSSTTTWEDGANKTLAFTGTEPTNSAGYHQVVLTPYYFNNVKPGDLLDADTTVTFRVDMRNARATDGTAFDPQSQTVSLNGSFLLGGWQPWGGLTDTQAYDDGATSGDTTAGDGIYSVQVLLPRGTSTRLEYKYGIGGNDNEAAQGTNHVRYVRSTGSYTMPVDTFGTMTQESQTTDPGHVAINRAGGKITITWSAQAGVHLQKFVPFGGPGTTTDVSGTNGQGSYDLRATDVMGFYRLIRQ